MHSHFVGFVMRRLKYFRIMSTSLQYLDKENVHSRVFAISVVRVIDVVSAYAASNFAS